MFNLILFGPPGSGKGTQSELLIKRYNLVHLSTGDLLRAEIAQNTSLGIQAKSLIDKGNLVPDEVVVRMIKIQLENSRHADGFIFDGFPRTITQATALDELMRIERSRVNAFIGLEVPHDELTNRLLMRGKDSGRTDDQSAQIIEKRIKVYNDITAPVINYYMRQNKYIGINGLGDIHEISARISEKADALK